MASVTVTLPNARYGSSGGVSRWEVNRLNAIDLGTSLSVDGSTQLYLGWFRLPRLTTASEADIRLQATRTSVDNPSDTGPEFSTQMENSGTVTVVSSDGNSTLVITGIGDATEPYLWVPPNLADVRAFAVAVHALADRSITVTFNDNATVAPSWTDDTGDDQFWNTNNPISSIIVPEADGTPTPTYAPVGALPNGIQFNNSTRVLSGTPTSVGSGTITIRATNSEDSADWTIDYSITEPIPASVNATLPDNLALTANNVVSYNFSTFSRPSLGTTLSRDPSQVISLDFISLPRNSSGGPVAIQLARGFESVGLLGPDFSDQMENNGTILFTASNGDELLLTGLVDRTDPYAWTPSNIADVYAFASTVESLTDRTVTVVFNNGAGVAPSFDDDTGDSQTWIVGTAITPITVPLANGNPPPTYSSVGSIPNGINFNSTTRIISGTPTIAGSGTIRIRATNSEGSDDWTVDYSANPSPAEVTNSQLISTPVALSDTYGVGEHIEIQVFFDAAVDVTGVPEYPINLGQSPSGSPERVDYNRGSGTDTLVFRWTVASTDLDTNGVFFYRNRSEAFITLPGSATIRNAGTSIDVDLELDASGVISGTQGGHKVDGSLLPLTSPSFSDDTGDAQTWNIDVAISPITVPAASGNPTPTYAVVGSPPDGINFNNTTRVISGSPTSAGSGTITIRANNSEGSDDWTVAYTTVGDHNAEIQVRAGLPEVSFSPQSQNIDNDAAFSARSNDPSVSFAPDSIGISNDVQLSVRAGTPGVNFTPDSIDINNDASFDVRSGLPQASFSPQSEDIHNDAAFSVSSGLPSVNFLPDTQGISNDAEIQVRAGLPEVSFTPTSMAVNNHDAEFAARSGAPQVSFIPDSSGVLQRSDYVSGGGFRVDVLGLITAGGTDVYQDGSSGTVEAGSDLQLDDIDKLINRIRVQGGGNTLTINGSGADGWSVGFEGTGPYLDAIIDIQTLDGIASFTVANPDELDDAGGGFIRYRTTDQNDIDILNSLQDGVRFIIAIRRPILNSDVTFEVRSDSPTVDLVPDAQDVNQDAELSVRSGLPIVGFVPNSLEISNDAQLSVRSGDPSVVFAPESLELNNDVSFAIRSGTPQVSFVPESQGVDQDVEFSVRAGLPTVGFVPQSQSIHNDAEFSVSAGSPTVNFVPSSVVAIITNYDAGFGARSGNPLVTFFPLFGPDFIPGDPNFNPVSAVPKRLPRGVRRNYQNQYQPALNLEDGKLVTGHLANNIEAGLNLHYIAGLDSIMQWISKLFLTESSVYPIYTPEYGLPLRLLIGSDISRTAFQELLQLLVIQAVTQHPNITRIDNYESRIRGSRCFGSFDVVLDTDEVLSAGFNLGI